MTDENDFKISIGTADKYEDYIAEIRFPRKAAFIISQEKAPGDFEISLHSFIETQADDFDNCNNVEVAKIPLTSFRNALELAINELKGLKKVS